MAKNKRASFRIDKEDWKTFKETAEDLGTDASNVLRMFIKNFNEKKSFWFLKNQ